MKNKNGFYAALATPGVLWLLLLFVVPFYAVLAIAMGKLDRLIPWTQAARLVEEAGGPAELLLLEQGNHGCANLSPFHRYRTADWVAGQLGAQTRRPAGMTA